ncbi:hypothetical protein HA464_03240 [Rhizobium leguminosarum bv. trifolii]|uniref:hypothetical protein n=1 Tax=Rhizobium ruizarguesonis TaxID=2081791 RepID=UPI0010323F56|nr:hypothetical protein [Rhizobium ruizarguesonis]QIO43092.1 hypothetical protein HA464_03240 [Rhizobium leguminosarum bv. trifolii]TAZ19508.1 hypothetical protein ELH77_12380 [Rhizobium ruizarguesonis]
MAGKLEKVEIALGGRRFMYRAADGGPIRFGVTGRKRNSTHIYNSSKVANHILPAESDAELQVITLLDLSTSVLTYMAQPHTLKLPKTCGKGTWIYTPDFEVIVPRWFIRQLESGMPFALAALKMPQRRASEDDLVRLVLEVKGASRYADLRERDLTQPGAQAKADKREAEKEDYQAKLREAHATYRGMGYHFYLVDELRDLRTLDLRHLPSILMDDDVKVTWRHVNLAWKHLQNRSGLTTYKDIIDALGGGPLGRETANCLHVRGLIWIDLSKNPQPVTTVAMPPLLGSRRDLGHLLASEMEA